MIRTIRNDQPAHRTRTSPGRGNVACALIIRESLPLRRQQASNLRRAQTRALPKQRGPPKAAEPAEGINPSAAHHHFLLLIFTDVRDEVGRDQGKTPNLPNNLCSSSTNAFRSACSNWKTFHFRPRRRTHRKRTRSCS
jgi:hypothetical protein